MKFYNTKDIRAKTLIRFDELLSPDGMSVFFYPIGYLTGVINESLADSF